MVNISLPNPRRHTASRLAGDGAAVIVHGRRETAVREAVEFVKGCGKGQRVEGVVADVSSLHGMNHLCDEVLARTDRLDCLINNAGEKEVTLQILVEFAPRESSARIAQRERERGRERGRERVVWYCCLGSVPLGVCRTNTLHCSWCDEFVAEEDILLPSYVLSLGLMRWTGVFEADFRHSEDGVEYTFAVNVLAPYVITGRLLDLIAKAPEGGRVVNVASLSASYSLDFDNLQVWVAIQARLSSGFRALRSWSSSGRVAFFYFSGDSCVRTTTETSTAYHKDRPARPSLQPHPACF